MTERAAAKHDYEYTRNGTTNLFVAVEPKAGQSIVSVTAQRGKVDLVAFVVELLDGTYAKARRVHLVLDNLTRLARARPGIPSAPQPTAGQCGQWDFARRRMHVEAGLYYCAIALFNSSSWSPSENARTKRPARRRT